MSAGQEYERWYILPATQDGEGRNVPKYAFDDPAIDRISGTTTTPDVIEQNYVALIQTNPGIDLWYIIWLTGVGQDGWQSLNEISVKADTRNLATNVSDVADVLNQRLPDLNRSGEAWEKSFRVIRG